MPEKRTILLALAAIAVLGALCFVGIYVATAPGDGSAVRDRPWWSFDEPEPPAQPAPTSLLPPKGTSAYVQPGAPAPPGVTAPRPIPFPEWTVDPSRPRAGTAEHEVERQKKRAMMTRRREGKPPRSAEDLQ